MFEYETAGSLVAAGAAEELLLPVGRPLSYLRVRLAASTQGLNRVLLERRATEFRVRIPVVLAAGEGRDAVSEALARRQASAVFPVLEADDDGEVVDLCWLDWMQLSALGIERETEFARSEAGVETMGIRIAPVFRPAASGAPVLRSWQYWNSDWEFTKPSAGREEWWRVRPNEHRDRPLWPWRPSPRSSVGAAQARGTFVACLHRSMLDRIGNPRYVVVGHPYRESWLPVLALREEFGDSGDGEGEVAASTWTETIFLDRTAREALGIADGEFCLVRPWHSPRRSIWWRTSRDKLVGSRMISAHVLSPARADLEKPVCRLEPQALDAIGGRPGERVTIEYVKPGTGSPQQGRWQRVSLTQRALPIDADERAERSKWESAQLWDEASMPGTAGREAPRLEGYVDCGERLGVHPPYPSIYLNYYTRRSGLAGVRLCQPVQVRVGVPGRLTAEASEFAWLLVIALLGATIAFVHSEPWQIAAAAALLIVTVWLVAFRTIQAIR